LYFTAKILQEDTKQMDKITYASADLSQKTTKGSSTSTNSVQDIKSKVQEASELAPNLSCAPRLSTNTGVQPIEPRLETTLPLAKEQHTNKSNQSKLICAMQYHYIW